MRGSRDCHFSSTSDAAIFSNVIQVFDAYAASVCHPGDLNDVHVGMSDVDVAAVAGAPRLPADACWYYPVTATKQGLRVCFKNGRASIVQAALHS